MSTKSKILLWVLFFNDAIYMFALFPWNMFTANPFKLLLRSTYRITYVIKFTMFTVWRILIPCTSSRFKKTQTNKQKNKNVEIKQRNSSICSVYLIERLALGLPIQQSLESLGAKMLLLWYWKMQIIQCISLYVCCSDLADLLQDSYRI